MKRLRRGEFENKKGKIYKSSYFELLIVTMSDVVKINKDLLKRIKKLIKKKNKKIRYSNRKQFVNMAVLKLLEREEK